MLKTIRGLLCPTDRGQELDQTTEEQEARIAEQQTRITDLQEQNADLSRRLERVTPEEWPELETTTVEKATVESALEAFDEWPERQAYWWDDYKYRAPTVAGFEAVVERDAVDEKAYVSEFFDCDNYADSIAALFARRYACNAVGVVISPEADPPHAFNVAVVQTADGIEARLWEPQSDEWVTTDDDDKYTLNGALIRI